MFFALSRLQSSNSQFPNPLANSHRRFKHNNQDLQQDQKRLRDFLERRAVNVIRRELDLYQDFVTKHESAHFIIVATISYFFHVPIRRPDNSYGNIHQSIALVKKLIYHSQCHDLAYKVVLMAAVSGVSLVSVLASAPAFPLAQPRM